MIRFLAISALTFALAPACSKKDDTKAKEAAKPPTAEVVPEIKPAEVPQVAPVLIIKAAKLKLDLVENNPEAPTSIELHDSGEVMVDGEILGTISTDGVFVDVGGKEYAAIAADGTMKVLGADTTMVLGADSSVQKDGQIIAQYGEGNTLVAEEMPAKIVFEGPDEAKRAMMGVFLVLMMTAEPTDDSGADDEASAEAPTEEE